MRQIIPFKKEILFKTKICEITSISLEHTLSLVEDDLINGEFIISGDYKMTEGSINREEFLYKIPCEISLNSKYNKDNLVIDIDNFYYEVVNNEYLNVFIDLYIDGEEISNNEKNNKVVIDDRSSDDNDDKDNADDISIVSNIDKENATLDIESINNNKDLIKIENTNIKDVVLDKDSNDKKTYIEEIKKQADTNINNNKDNDIILDNDNKNEFNIFNGIDNSDSYVTYHVYIIRDDDNIDSILNKFKVNKDILSEYNDINNIKPKDKLIIPNVQDE